MSKIVSREVGLEVASLAATKKRGGGKIPMRRLRKNKAKVKWRKLSRINGGL